MRDRWNWKIKRMSKDITLKELAKELNCSIGLISKWENDERNMSDDKVEKYKNYIEEK